jgi:hypothetical protein
MSFDLITELDTEKPDPEWWERLKDRGFLLDQPVVSCCDGCAPILPLMQKLKNILSVIGYALVLPHFEEDIIPLISRGEFIQSSDEDILVEGEPIHCHSNAANLWSQNTNCMNLMTGYGLSDRGGIWTNEELSTDIIVETTIPRILYYGYRMTPKEAYIFEGKNLC